MNTILREIGHVRAREQVDECIVHLSGERIAAPPRTPENKLHVNVRQRCAGARCECRSKGRGDTRHVRVDHLTNG